MRMHWKITYVSAALGLLLPLPTAAQHHGVNIPCPAIVTTGEAIARAAPDRAFVNAVAEARARDPDTAQREAAKAMAAVHATLKGLGLVPEAIRTLHYALNPQYDHIKGRQTLRGYEARHAIEIRVDDLSRVGTIIEATVDAGATSIAGVRFGLQHRDELEREALRQAVADARARIDAVAASAGVAVERIWSVEQQRLPHPPPVPMMSARAGAAEDVAPPIAPGPIEVHETVTLTACIR